MGLLMAELNCGVEWIDVLKEDWEGHGAVGPQHENVVDEA